MYFKNSKTVSFDVKEIVRDHIYDKVTADEMVGLATLDLDAIEPMT